MLLLLFFLEGVLYVYGQMSSHVLAKNKGDLHALLLLVCLDQACVSYSNWQNDWIAKYIADHNEFKSSRLAAHPSRAVT